MAVRGEEESLKSDPYPSAGLSREEGVMTGQSYGPQGRRGGIGNTRPLCGYNSLCTVIKAQNKSLDHGGRSSTRPANHRPSSGAQAGTDAPYPGHSLAAAP